MSFLIGTRTNGNPSPLEQAQLAEKRRKDKATEVYGVPEPVDRTAESADGPPPDDTETAPGMAKSRGPIANAIEQHNALAPTPERAGRPLVAPPTSLCDAPLDPRYGSEAPAAPLLASDRGMCSLTPDSSSPASLVERSGPNRPQTTAPAGLDFTSTAGPDTAASRNPDGTFTGAGNVPVARLDLQAQHGANAAVVFSRPNVALSGRAANSPSTRQPNTSTNERTGQ